MSDLVEDRISHVASHYDGASSQTFKRLLILVHAITPLFIKSSYFRTPGTIWPQNYLRQFQFLCCVNEVGRFTPDMTEKLLTWTLTNNPNINTYSHHIKMDKRT